MIYTNNENTYNILFLYKPYLNYIGTVFDYTKAFQQHSKHNIFFHDPANPISEDILRGFDAVIINYCAISLLHHYSAFPNLKSLTTYKGKKIAILQDEYDSAIINRDKLIRLNLDCIVTTIPNPDDYRKVYYGDEFKNTEFIQALTGYVTEDMLNSPPSIPFSERKWMIGYRGRVLPYRYGKLVWGKYIIGIKMAEICQAKNICSNIAVDDNSRIYGSQWPDFIRNCRVVLGTESGSNVFDFDNTLDFSIKSYIKKHPDADFDTIYNLFIKDYDEKIKMNQISPKIFEAISLKTGLMLFEGEYSGIIKPWKHFIPLKKDFSNIEEALKAVNNIPLLEEITEQAYRDVIASGAYSFSAFVKNIDDWLENKLNQHTASCKPICMLAGWREANKKSTFLLDTTCLSLPFSKILHYNDDIVKVFTAPKHKSLRLIIRELLLPYKSTYKFIRWIYRVLLLKKRNSKKR